MSAHQTRISTRITSAVIVLMGVYFPHEAAGQTQANAAANAVYEDLRDIIGRLVEREAAESIAANLTCSGPPGLLVYFPRTLQSGFDAQFGSLGPILRAEVADVAGSYVLALAAVPAMANGESPSLGDILINRNWVTPWQQYVAPNAVRKEASDVAPASLAECAGVIRFAGGPSEFKRQSSKYMKAPPGSGNAAKPVPINPKLIDQCSGAALHGSDLRLRVSCELALATREGVLGSEQGAEEHLVRAIGTVIYAHLMKPYDEAELERTLSALSRRLRQATASLPTSEPASDPKVMPMLDTVAGLWSVETGGGARRLDVRAAIANVLLVLKRLNDTPCASEQPCAVLDQLRNALSALERGTATVDYSQMLDALARKDWQNMAIQALSISFSVVSDQVDGQCEKLELSDVHPEDATVQSLDAVRSGEGSQQKDEQPQKDDKAKKLQQCEAARNIKLYGRFLVAVAKYGVELDNGAPREATRAALRDVAIDVLRTNSPGSGVERHWYEIQMPTLALRISTNVGYVNGTTSEGFRFLPTVTWPTLRIPLYVPRSRSAYAGLQLSLANAAAPFTEIALRDNSRSYNDAHRNWWNFLHPSVDLLFAVPALTPHLALSAGISMRTAVVFTEPDGTSDYRTLWGRPSGWDDSREYYGRFVEANLAIQYVP